MRLASVNGRAERRPSSDWHAGATRHQHTHTFRLCGAPPTLPLAVRAFSPLMGTTRAHALHYLGNQSQVHWEAITDAVRAPPLRRALVAMADTCVAGWGGADS
jgi:hypothetical protein